MKNLKHFLLIGSAVVGLNSLNGCAVAAVGAGVGAGVAAGTDSRGTSTVVDDQSLEHTVNSTLKNYFPKANFTVASYNQRVLIAGQVANNEQKSAAGSKIAALPEVKSVWNYLEVAPNISVGQITKDAYVTSAAKTRLIAQKGVNANNIKVVTENGKVYLMGKDAGDSAQIAGAIDGIRQIDGCKKVVNLIKS